MSSFNMRSIAALVLAGATGLVSAAPGYGKHHSNGYGAYESQPQCQTQLRNFDFSESFNQVPIWKEPWVEGTCRGAGDCEFTGPEPFEGSPLQFNLGGHMTTPESTAQVGQSFTLCPRDYDYKLYFKSAVLGNYLAEGTSVKFIMQIGEAFVNSDPIPLTVNHFGEAYVEIPGSKTGGKGFAFWTGAAGAENTILVDEMKFI